jgi:hypothetical protein
VRKKCDYRNFSQYELHDVPDTKENPVCLGKILR